MSGGCYSDDQLQGVLTGGIQGDLLDDVARHLDDCKECLARMDGFAGGVDGFKNVLDPLPGRTSGDKEVLQQLLQRLQAGAATRFAANSGRARDVSTTVLKRMGSYEIIEELGRGGMGIVFKARQVRLNRLVALKVLLSGELASLSDLRRFQAEAEAVARLEHPNIVPIYGVGEHGSYRYISMRFVEGKTLGTLSRACRDRGRAWFRQSVLWLIPIARAVHYAHQRGILHRDVKPGNILVDHEGKAYLTDFGLAKMTGSTVSMTGSRSSLGTPQYASPEQLDGRTREVTTASDVYSLGAVLYELLVGRPPFVGNTPVATVRQVLDRQPKSPRLLNPSLDQDLTTICLKCLGKEPAQRYSSAEAMAEDLERWISRKPIRARPVRPGEHAIRFMGRYPVGSTLAILLMLALTIGGVLLVQSNRDMRRALGSAAEAREAELWAHSMKELTIHNGLIGQASAIRSSAAVGRRFDAINVLQQAADIRQSGRLATEAAAALANLDLREVSRHSLPPIPASETLRYGFLTLDADLEFVVTSYPAEGLMLSRLGEGGPVRRFDESSGAVFPSVTLSPDGRWFVSRRFSMIELWRADGAGPVKRWPLRSGEVHKFVDQSEPAAFRGDSRLLAVPAETGGVRLVRLTSSLPERVVAAGLDPSLLAFDPISGRLAVSEGAGLRILDGESGEELVSFSTPGDVRWFGWSPSGEQIAVASRHHMPLGIRDARTGELVVTLGLAAPASRLAFHPKGRMLAVATDNKQVGLWDPSTARKIMEFEGHPRVLQFSTDGTRLAVANTMDQIICYEVARSKVYREFVGQPGPRSDSGYAMDVSSDGRVVVTADATSLRFWDVDRGVETFSAEQPSSLWTHVRFLPGDRALVVNPMDQGVFQRSFHWQDSGETPCCVGAMEPLVDAPYYGYWGLHDRHAVVLAHQDAEVQLWFDRDPETYQVIGHLGNHFVTIPNLSPDETLLALNHSPGGKIEIWATQDARLLRTLSDSFYTGATFTPDGRHLLAATRDQLALWDVGSWKPVQTVREGMSRREFECLLFSPDGRLLLVQTSPTSHQVYSYPDFSEVVALTSPHTLSRHHCEWSGDGHRVYTLGRGNHLYEWNLPALDGELRRLGFLGDRGTTTMAE